MEKIENKEIQRIMIAERVDEINRKKYIVEGLVKVGNELSELYKGLSMGAFTADDLKDAICNSAQGIKRRYIEQAETEAALSISSLRDEVVNKAKQFQNPFQERVNRLNRSITSPDRALLKYLTVTDTGEVVFTDDNAKALEEDTHVYLTDPEQIEKYMIHRAIIRLLNEFFDNGDGLPFMWFQLFPMNSEGVFVMPEQGADYSGMLERVACKRGYDVQTSSLSPEQTDTPKEKAENETPKQQNRQRGAITKGISKEPDYIEHIEHRAGRAKVENVITVQKGRKSTGI